MYSTTWCLNFGHMKNINVIIVLVLTIQLIQAQKFEKLYRLIEPSNDFGAGTLEVINGEIICSFSSRNKITDTGTIALIRLKSNGDEMLTFFFRPKGHSTSFGNIKRTINNKIFTFGDINHQINNNVHGLLLELDSLGNIVHDHLYPSVSTLFFINNIYSVNDGYLILGSEEKYDPNPPNDYIDGQGRVMKVDTNFNIVWSRVWGDSTKYTEKPRDVVVTEDGNYLIVGYKYESYFLGTYFQAMMVRMDNSGNILSEKYWGPLDQRTYFSKITKIGYDNYLASGSSNHIKVCNACRIGIIAHLNSQGDVINYKEIPTLKDMDLNDHIVIDDKVYLVGVDRDINSNKLWGWFGITDTAGNLLHEQRYSPNPTQTCYLWNMSRCANGDFLLSGDAINPTPGGNQDAWLLRVDSMGCVVYPDCYVSVEEINHEAELPETISIYPNPASDILHIRMNTFKEGKIHFRILDITGKEWMHWDSYGMEEVQRDVSELPGGVYFTEVIQKERHATLRWVKE